MLLALTGGFVWLAIFSSLARLLGYLICVLALPVLQTKHKFTTNLKAWTSSVLGALACLWLISQASAKAWLFLVAFVLCGATFYWWSVTRVAAASEK